jgi:uncharacterized membrane protein
MTDEMQPGQTPAAPPPASPEAKPEQPKTPRTVGPEQAKLLAALCYFGLLLIVPLLIARDNEHVQFHLRQGIVWLVGWVLASLLFAVPFLGPSLAVAALAVSVYAAIQAYEGKRWEMPYLGKYAKLIKI